MKGCGKISISLPDKKCPKNEASFSKQDFANSTREQSSCILTCEKVSTAACDISDEHVHVTLGCGNLLEQQNISAKSDISSEVERDNNEGDARRALVNSGENGLSSITQTESSCSNSDVTHQVNSSSQETSTEAKTFMQQNGSASAPISFISSMEDPVTSSEASGLAAQNSVGNVKANTKALVGMVKDQNSLHLSTCSHQLRKNHRDKVSGGVDCSGNHNCSAQTNKESHSRHFYSKGEEEVLLHLQSENRSSSLESEEMGDPAKKLEFNGGLKSPACPLTKCEIDQRQTSVVNMLDLNEDVNQNDLDDDAKQSNGQNIVIRVVAKYGVPLPPLSTTVNSLKFEGRLGWRGTAATSAFRPAASLSKSSDWDTKRIMEFDLNVAAASEDELPSENRITSTFRSYSSNQSSKQAEKMFNFDLNLLGDNADEKSSFPVKSEKLSSFSLNLNEDPQFQKRIIESAACPVFSRDDQDLKFVRLGTWGDMKNSGQPFLVATPNTQHTVQNMVPLQSKLPYAVQMLPSYSSYPSNNGPLYIAPCARDTHEGVTFPQVLNMSTFPGGPYLIHGQRPGGATRLDVNSGQVYLMNGLRKDNIATHFFPIQSTEEQRKVYEQPSMPMKRREPEGGYDSFQSATAYKHKN
uniref:Uncharacterized protein n=1 Tax=Nicotiana tabacum TaxID=4097 RepID=A0A1S4C6F4_TOBAC|nr:PREDICTED: uncharacterized protein LOC107815702 [Nicotiana tabacum]XP_016496805.1 PREDICTED: uncharacterized protein LOC107815702 [Nicotiana tabacum]